MEKINFGNRNFTSNLDALTAHAKDVNPIIDAVNNIIANPPAATTVGYTGTIVLGGASFVYTNGVLTSYTPAGGGG